jgi:hypothetical protein
LLAIFPLLPATYEIGIDVGSWPDIKRHLCYLNFLDLEPICYTIGMKREDYLKDYYKTLEEASLEVLEEHKHFEK